MTHQPTRDPAQARLLLLTAVLFGSYPTQQILDRAVIRGEVAPGRVTPRLLRLPVDLARHEMMITFQPLPEAVILEIVDDIVLPLWTGQS